MATKEVQNYVTDRSGSFSSKLISGYTYQIRYFKNGFKSNTKTINTGTKVSKDAIGSILLKKESTIMSSAPIASAPSQPNTSTRSTAPQPASRSSYSSTSTISSGFSVQIAAVKASKPLDISKYTSRLSSIGNVYVKKASDYNRVRVGVYRTKAEAESIKSRVNAAGYGSAYVVTEDGVTNKSGSEELFTSRNSSPSTSTSTVSEYKIRLAALRNTGNIDRELLNRYGRIETTQSNGLTIFYLAGFSNKSDANKVLANLQTKGYPSAYLVQKINGSLQKISN